MSNHGPYPGPPQEPWPGQQPQEPYAQPTDPWGGSPDPWGGAPASTPPGGPGSPAGTGYQPGGYDQGGFPPPGGGYQGTRQFEPGYAQPVGPRQDPVWGQPVAAPPQKRGGNGLIIALVAVLAVLVIGGGAVSAYFLLNNDGKQGDPTTVAESPASNGGPTGTARPQTPASASPTPSAAVTSGASGSSTDARFAKKGQCVVNEGTDEAPKLKITKCGPTTYEILERFDATIDFKTKCATVKDYEFHYFFNSEYDALDYVLCMKLRKDGQE